MKNIFLLVGKLRLVVLFLCATNVAHSAALTAVAVSSMSTSAGVVTVTTGIAHGLTVNQGICLSFGTGTCGTIATAPTATTFTLSGNITCVTTCGTVQAAPQIILLQATPITGTSSTVIVAFWLTTTTGITATRTSAWTGASSAQNTALTQGQFVEQIHNYTFSASDFASNNAVIKQVLTDAYASAQTDFSNSPQPGSLYGVFYNGGWSQ